jgi:hypothetical protein
MHASERARLRLKGVMRMIRLMRDMGLMSAMGMMQRMRMDGCNVKEILGRRLQPSAVSWRPKLARLRWEQ